VLHAVGAVIVPHVPDVGADCLCHTDAVARIAIVSLRQNRFALPILRLHGDITLESATRQDNAAACTHALDARNIA